MVCRTFANTVTNLSVWSEMYAKAHHTNQNHLVGGIKPVVGKDSNKDFMLHMCAESFRVCEMCLSIYSGSDISQDRLASLPLPVHMWRVRAALKKVEFLPLSSKVFPKDWVIRLCVSCRKMVFEQCPESISGLVRKANNRSSHLAAKYHLTERDIARSTFMSEETALVKARSKYGGDVGIEGAAPGSSAKVIESTESRLEEICLRFTVVAMDG
ncbi:hypothetical protein B0O80DRAFT_465197 [Mortierella sp. GBAus27b]|nr:hypothetical protein B0O80DRAFT_465197 [Mortierella sp. GBAus27b]